MGEGRKKWSVRAGVLQMTSLGGLAGKFQGDNKYFKADHVSASSGGKDRISQVKKVPRR